MMKLFRLKPIAPADPLIPILFGEWELDLQKKHIPAFVDVRSSGDTTEAVKILRSIMNDGDSLHRVFVWHELKDLGVQPEVENAKQVLGVVVEVGMRKGTDYLAAYSDLTARYYNYTGSKVFLEANIDPVNESVKDIQNCIEELIDSCRAIVDNIGLWEGPRRNVPKKGNARITIITPSGLFFGEGSMAALARDSMAAPAMSHATSLMTKLIDLAKVRQ
ncbi:MAG: hypothetical protein SCM11_07195 [Bacillota bacterium]|nr:hypothetical protein [Bacillota bacterium]